MTIRNIGTKIVNIGTTVLMPDCEMGNVDSAVVAAPSIQTLINMNLIAVMSEEKAPDAPNSEPGAPSEPAPGPKGEETKKGADAETGKKGSTEKKSGSST